MADYRGQMKTDRVEGIGQRRLAARMLQRTAPEGLPSGRRTTSRQSEVGLRARARWRNAAPRTVSVIGGSDDAAFDTGGGCRWSGRRAGRSFRRGRLLRFPDFIAAARVPTEAGTGNSPEIPSARDTRITGYFPIEIDHNRNGGTLSEN